MNYEVTILAVAVLLGIVHILLGASEATRVRGIKWNMGSRDEQKPPLHGRPGRVVRASENFKETFPLFLAAVLVVVVSGRAGSVTAIGATMYIAGRVLYLPAYVFEWTGIRSLFWLVAMAGIVTMLGGAFFA